MLTEGQNRVVETCPTPTKAKHVTEADALVERNRFVFDGHGSKDVGVYKCRCGFWHVGHSKERLNWRISRSLRGGRMPGQRRRKH